MGFFGTTIRNIDRSTTINHPKNITVTEKRAPTDESIKLWDEHIEKATKRVMSVFKIDSTYFSAISVAFCHESFCEENPSIKYRITFKINGKDEEVRFEIDPFEVKEMSRMLPISADEKLIKLIVEKVSKIITIRILQEVNLEDLGVKNIKH